jgi:acyl-coenzyme A thioesterase PaaI-like protein
MKKSLLVSNNTQTEMTSHLFFKPYPPFFNPSKMSLHQQKTTHSVLEVPIHQTLGFKLQSQSSTPTPTATITFTTNPIHLTPRHTVHGGISTLALDTACSLAVIPTLSEGQAGITIASSFQLLGSTVGEGKIYRVEGRVVRRGERIVFCEGEVMCEGKLIAKGNVTKMLTSSDKNDKSKL